MLPKYLLRVLEVAMGLALEIAGLIGAGGAAPTWVKFIEQPRVYILAVALGTVVLAYTFGDALADHRISSAGGISKKAFPAKFSDWDKLSAFPVWQIAWLWMGLEPFDPETRQTPAYPAFRRLEEHLDAGKIADVTIGATGWRDVSITREQLVNYAHSIGERPRFLFAEERSWISRVRARWTRHEPIDPAELGSYQNIYYWYYIGSQMNPPLSSEAVRSQLIDLLRNGGAEAVGKPRLNGIDYPHVRLPKSAYKKIVFDWADSVTIGGREYLSLRTRTLKQDHALRETTISRLLHSMLPFFGSDA